MLIHSVYKATEGEGIFIGAPQIFVRFQGCNIGCINCDSKETWAFEADKNNSIEMVIAQVNYYSQKGYTPLKRVSITGGDPLDPRHEKDTLALVKVLKDEGYFVNIEASGSRIVEEIFDRVDFISFDVKTPSTGVKFSESILRKLIEHYSNKAQIKAVVADSNDFNTFMELKKKFSSTQMPWVITPCFDPEESFPQKRFQDISHLNENAGGPFRVIAQQHKWIYGTDSLLN